MRYHANQRFYFYFSSAVKLSRRGTDEYFLARDFVVVRIFAFEGNAAKADRWPNIDVRTCFTDVD